MKYSLIVVSLFLVACGKGVPGEQGVKGDTGATGPTGSSCTVQQANNGAIISCSDGSSVLVLNGTNGTNGRDGTNGVNAVPSAYSIVEIIDPCGPMTGYYNEILLRLADRTLIAFFEDGSQRFLAEITPGTYKTTDKQNCIFTISSNLNVSW